MASSTGGPAFPAEGGSDSGPHANPGMTLLDYFAASALAHLSQPLLTAMYATGTIPNRDDVAALCYQIAAAMLAEKQRLEATT